MTNITVGTAGTAVVAANTGRTNLALQHIGTATAAAAARVWVSTDDALAIGGGFMLSGLGVVLNISREHGANLAWYAIAEADGVTLQVSEGSYR